MSDEKLLTKEIAEQFLADEESVDLSEFTSIADDAAVVLAKYKDCCLDLSGLTAMSDSAAESLSCFGNASVEEGDCELHLGGLTNLSDSAAKSLSKCKSHVVLSGVNSMTDTAVEALASKGWVHLDGFTSLSDETAEILSRCEEVCLDSLTVLSDAAAKSLSKVKNLSLLRLTTISEKSATMLNQGKNKITQQGMKPLKCLTKELVDQMLTEENDFELDQYTLLTDEAAKSLAGYRGYLTFDSLVGLSEEAASCLASHVGELDFSNLTNLSPKALAALKDHEGFVALGGSYELTHEHAKALSEFKSGFEVNADISDMDELTRATLMQHPIMRRFDDNELEEWLLDRCGFDEDKEGTDWTGCDFIHSIQLDECALSESRHNQDDLRTILKEIHRSGRQEIHLVDFKDDSQYLLVFIGGIESVKARLEPYIEKFLSGGYDE